MTKKRKRSASALPRTVKQLDRWIERGRWKGMSPHDFAMPSPLLIWRFWKRSPCQLVGCTTDHRVKLGWAIRFMLGFFALITATYMNITSYYECMLSMFVLFFFSILQGRIYDWHDHRPQIQAIVDRIKNTSRTSIVDELLTAHITESKGRRLCKGRDALQRKRNLMTQFSSNLRQSTAELAPRMTYRSVEVHPAERAKRRVDRAIDVLDGIIGPIEDEYRRIETKKEEILIVMRAIVALEAAEFLEAGCIDLVRNQKRRALKKLRELDALLSDVPSLTRMRIESAQEHTESETDEHAEDPSIARSGTHRRTI